MRPRAIAIVAALAYAIFLVALVPASVVADRVTAATRGQVSIANAGGTLWHGSARMRVTVAGGWLDLESVQWDLEPMGLLSGRLAFDAHATAPGIEAKAHIGRGVGAWQLDNAVVLASVPALATVAPMAARWRPEGRLIVDVPGWEWNERGVRGQASVEWEKAAISLSEVKPLGKYRLRATGDGGSTAQLVLRTFDGPLQVEGKGTAGPAEIRFSGEARSADPSVTKALDPLLDLLGPRRPDGARALELRIAL